MSETEHECKRDCHGCEAVRFFAETLWALPKTFADTIRVHPYDLADTIDRLVTRYETAPMARWERDLLDAVDPSPVPGGDA
jgi:hypothetical protein